MLDLRARKHARTIAEIDRTDPGFPVRREAFLCRNANTPCSLSQNSTRSRLPLLALLVLLGLASCRNTQYLQQEQSLYKASDVLVLVEGGKELAEPSPERDSAAVWNKAAEIETQVRSIDFEQPLPQVPQLTSKEASDIAETLARIDPRDPNSKALGIFPFRLWFYNNLSQSETGPVENWLNNGSPPRRVKTWIASWLYPDNGQTLRAWFRDQVGEPPVLYDSLETVDYASRMERWLEAKGFFHPKVYVKHDEVRRQTTARYAADPGFRYRIRSITYETSDSLIKALISKPIENPWLQVGAPYDLDRLRKERTRIRDTLQSNGYFRFDRSFVEFAIDSGEAGQHELDVYVQILDPVEGDGHQRYFIGDVYCNPEYNLARVPGLRSDTILFEDIIVITATDRIKPSTLGDAIFLVPGKYYDVGDHTLTLRKLNELGAFRYVSMDYRERRQGDSLFLDAEVRLQPMKKQSWSVELNTNTNFGTQIGSDLNFTYRNRNLFRNADLFSFNLSGGVQTQTQDQIQTIFQNVEISAQASLDIPKFILPWEVRNARTFNPKTQFAMRYSFVRRLEFYTLHTTGFTLSYSWQRNETIAHRIGAVDVSMVLPTEETQAFLDLKEQSLELTQAFQETFIPSTNYTFLYSNQNLKGRNSGMLFQANVDLAGNLFNAAHNIFLNDEVNRLDVLRITQYARINVDYRYYLRPTRNNTLVFRLAGGLGLPYGNAKSLPFVKQFFAGGPSSVRAWTVRLLGPGSYSVARDPERQGLFQDQTGDVLMEANLEYRFPVYQFIKGAVFLDAGNIWLLGEDESRPGGAFVSDFYRDIAVGTGVGLRFDFAFFVIRTDFGFKVRDPSLQGRAAWLMSDWSGYLDAFNDNMVFNIAIGYPF